MFYIIGLGNLGEKYKYTRHNVAWIIFDQILLDNWNVHKYMNAEIQSGNEGLYIKPQTFMNHSGEVVGFLKKEHSFEPEHIVVVYDDIDLPFGTVRISYDRGDGGHNGLKSITEHLGSKKTIRIRVGISRVLDDGRLVKPNVLGNFPSDELSIVKNSIAPRVEGIIKNLATEGRVKTMNIYNTKSN